MSQTHLNFTLKRIARFDSHFVVIEYSRGIGRLEEREQGGLVSIPNDEATGHVRLGGEVGGQKFGAQFAVQY